MPGWRRPWVKFWVNECLDGTVREELTAEERGVWYDLILISARGRTPGVISANESQSMSRNRLAGILNIPLELLERTLKKAVEQKRIKVDNNGLIHIMNWDKYQSEYQRQKKYRKKALHDKAGGF